MAIKYYMNTDGPTIESIETEQELFEAIDAIHTKVMDGLSEDHPTLKLLSDLMDKLMEMYPYIMPS